MVPKWAGCAPFPKAVKEQTNQRTLLLALQKYLKVQCIEKGLGCESRFKPMESDLAEASHFMPVLDSVLHWIQQICIHISIMPSILMIL